MTERAIAQRGAARRIQEQASRVAELSLSQATSAQQMALATEQQAASIAGMSDHLIVMQQVVEEMLGAVGRFDVSALEPAQTGPRPIEDRYSGR